jgi:hypothetical protein
MNAVDPSNLQLILAKFDLRRDEAAQFASKNTTTAAAYIRPGDESPVSAKVLSARM